MILERFFSAHAELWARHLRHDARQPVLAVDHAAVVVDTNQEASRILGNVAGAALHALTQGDARLAEVGRGRTTPASLLVPGPAGTRLALGGVWVGWEEGMVFVGESIQGVDVDLVEHLSRLSQALVAANERLQEKTRALEEVNASVTRLCMTDALTGVLNRHGLKERAPALFSFATRHGSPLGGVVLDLDFFKTINDTYGHPGGDLALTRLGALLRQLCRQEDLVFRMGGEEFFALLPGTDAAGARHFAARIQEGLVHVAVAPVLTPITASFGVGEALPGETLDALLSRLDAALYLAKGRGRDRIEVAG